MKYLRDNNFPHGGISKTNSYPLFPIIFWPKIVISEPDLECFNLPFFTETDKVGSGKNPDFSYWACSTPWGHVLSLKFFGEILSWAEQSGTQFFRRSNLLPRSLEFVCDDPFQLFDIWWSSLDKLNDFKAISRITFFRFCDINKSLF